MRRLLILRHAKAERAEAGLDDEHRGLVESGRKDAARIGAYIASHKLTPDHVMVSPAVRTQDTWKALALALRPAPAATTAASLYEASPNTLFNLVRSAPASTQSLMLVAHNPGLHELAVGLVASGDIETREKLNEKLPTCGLVVIDFAFDAWSALHPQSGRLDRFVSPRSLEASAA